MKNLISILSRFGPRESMDRLETEVRALGLEVFARIDHAAGAARVGMELLPTELIIFGSARAGTPLMQLDPTIGLDLPLKALVWQDAVGAVRITYRNPAGIAPPHGSEDEVKRMVARLDATLDKVSRKTAGEQFDRDADTPTTNGKIRMNTQAETTDIAEKFLTGLRTRDADLLRSILHENAVWSLPGDSLISGEARGAEAVIRRAQTIRDHGMTFTLKHLLVGHHGAALSLHNTARREGKVFDQDLATVLRVRDGKVTEINTYMSDVEMVNTYFAPA